MTREEFFNRYTFNRTRDLLGSGSFGSVFKAWDSVRDRWVALKISVVGGEAYRLKREVELVKKLQQNANVASYEECYTFSNETGEIDVAVLQYYPEGSLADSIASYPLPVQVATPLLTQVLNGLKFLHENGVLHRDLKPGNILIARRPDGTLVPKITDFGISRQFDADDTLTSAATVSYASPEQLGGEPMQANADLWSFGVIAYRTLTGKLPFSATSAAPSSLAGRAEIINKITTGQLPADIDLLPRPWNKVVKLCLVTDPAQRVGNEQTLLDIIEKEPMGNIGTDVSGGSNSGGAGNNGGGGSKATDEHETNIGKGETVLIPDGNNDPVEPSNKITTAIFIVSVLLLLFFVGLIGFDMYHSHQEKTKEITIPTWETESTVPEIEPVQEVYDENPSIDTFIADEPDVRNVTPTDDTIAEMPETVIPDTAQYSSSYYD
ncbi:MAG: serine/threonine protein kinase [Firmicutes bacterium]|nr:serine/threonine protein kinase [Bacillota bacterium]MCM1400768.1 serine/threonine protein kinase [Bacteroides sp.]MCM1477615.1 serine/threonine protein kinase [Bacteroides sp.]